MLVCDGGITASITFPPECCVSLSQRIPYRPASFFCLSHQATPSTSTSFLSHTHTHSLSLSHTHTLSLSHTHTHTHTLSLSLSHTYTHTLSLSLSHTHTLS